MCPTVSRLLLMCVARLPRAMSPCLLTITCILSMHSNYAAISTSLVLFLPSLNLLPRLQGLNNGPALPRSLSHNAHRPSQAVFYCSSEIGGRRLRSVEVRTIISAILRWQYAGCRIMACMHCSKLPKLHVRMCNGISVYHYA